MKKVKEIAIRIDKPKAVVESVAESPSATIHRRSQQLNISETSLRRILHKDLDITPYKVQLVQELKSIN